MLPSGWGNTGNLISVKAQISGKLGIWNIWKEIFWPHSWYLLVVWQIMVSLWCRWQLLGHGWQPDTASGHHTPLQCMSSPTGQVLSAALITLRHRGLGWPAWSKVLGVQWGGCCTHIVTSHLLFSLCHKSRWTLYHAAALSRSWQCIQLVQFSVTLPKVYAFWD